mmetsp:Transcript_119638/g.333901  ORF Transcript_119638/g.333901 Transcript_119638/m.333901 type:complete len:84 (-) Transcript_119638:21-272(-)
MRLEVLLKQDVVVSTTSSGSNVIICFNMQQKRILLQVDVVSNSTASRRPLSAPLSESDMLVGRRQRQGAPQTTWAKLGPKQRA